MPVKGIYKMDKMSQDNKGDVFEVNFKEWRKLCSAGLLAMILCVEAPSALADAGKDLAAANNKPQSDATVNKTSAGQLIGKGKYLVDAGDCRACHTRPGGRPFAGGLPIETAFGTVYSANITPDRETGIGAWSDDDFYRAMHKGRSPRNRAYYPVFPYAFFTKATKKDVLAIKAYLFSLKPVRYKKPANDMSWPYSYRPLLDVWQDLYLHVGTFRPDATKSAAYNRGAYLVEGLGHCGACHTPRNLLGATEPGRALTGAHIDGWFAPDISTDLRSTARKMSVGDIVTFLQTGASKPEASGFGPETAALGPMAEVVHKSLSHLTSKDLTAIATYLKNSPEPPDVEQGRQSVSPLTLSEGAKIYAANCSGCHGRQGDGNPPYFPALKGNTIVDVSDPSDVVRTVLHGAPQFPNERYSPYATMPAFGGQLNNKEVAEVTSFIRTHWGNDAPPVEPATVQALR